MYGGPGYQPGGRGPRGPMGYRGRGGQNDSRFHPYSSRGHMRPPRSDFGGYQRGPPPSHHYQNFGGQNQSYDNRSQFDSYDRQYPPNPVSARFFVRFFNYVIANYVRFRHFAITMSLLRRHFTNKEAAKGIAANFVAEEILSIGFRFRHLFRQIPHHRMDRQGNPVRNRRITILLILITIRMIINQLKVIRNLPTEMCQTDTLDHSSKKETIFVNLNPDLHMDKVRLQISVKTNTNFKIDLNRLQLPIVRQVIVILRQIIMITALLHLIILQVRKTHITERIST